MPKGSPTTQTKASEKYQKKVGLVAKSFKLKKDLAEEFRETCDRLGVAQANVLSEFMQKFIDDNKA